MEGKKFVIPKIFKQMDKLKYTDAKNDRYMWFFDMEWMTVKEILNYQHEEGEKKCIVPFAYTGGGDKWAWMITEAKDYPVVLCYHDDCEGEIYAKNTRDALFKHIIEFVSGDNFYLKKNEATSYQMDSNTLKNYLKEWQQKLSGFFTENQLMVLNKLNKRELFVCDTKFGRWCVLISPQEANCIINKYIKFDLEGKNIKWFEE